MTIKLGNMWAGICLPAGLRSDGGVKEDYNGVCREIEKR